MEILVVVDMQNDFINGSLGSQKAQEIVPRVEEKIRTFQGRVLATADTHEEDYLDTMEGKKLPVRHCIRGTKGWEIEERIRKLLPEPPIEKGTFGSRSLAEALTEIHKETPIGSITLIGLCTDICVISNAMLCKAFLPEVPVCVDASCCAGVTPESHAQALEAMKMCHIDIL